MTKIWTQNRLESGRPSTAWVETDTNTMQSLLRKNQTWNQPQTMIKCWKATAIKWSSTSRTKNSVTRALRAWKTSHNTKTSLTKTIARFLRSYQETQMKSTYHLTNKKRRLASSKPPMMEMAPPKRRLLKRRWSKSTPTLSPAKARSSTRLP